MPKPDLKLPIIEWLKKVKKDESIFTRRFFDIASLYHLYLATSNESGNKVTLSSFKRLIDSICSNGIYKNLKRKVHKRHNNKRFNEYIIVTDNEKEKDISDINVYFTRKRRTDMTTNQPSSSISITDKQTSTKKAKTVSALSSVDSRADSLNAVNEQTKTVAPTIKPNYIPNSPPTPTPTDPPTPTPTTPPTVMPTYIPYPVPVAVPVPIAIPTPSPIVASYQQTNSEQVSTPLMPSISSNSKVVQYINQSKDLDFEIVPRKNIFSPWLDDIPMKAKTKIADDNFKVYLLQIATELGYGQYTYKEQLELGNAIIRKECYIAGYEKPVITSRHFKDRIWDKYYKSRRLTPSVTSHVLDNKRGQNRMSYVAQISNMYPTMLHSLYRFATKLLGLDETSSRLAAAMNSRAQELFPDCPVRSNLKMNRNRFWEFFYTQGGKLKRQQTKPRLTDEHIKNRIKFAEKWLTRLNSGQTFYYCFLDKKWFYTTSRRKKEKHLPQAYFETLTESFIVLKKVRSRRFPCKVMYMGIVGVPIKGKTNGKIMMRRVCKIHQTKQESYNQNFSPFYELNNRLKMEEWQNLVPSGGSITVHDILDKIKYKYQIPPHIAKDLVFTYKTHMLSPRVKNLQSQKCRIERSQELLLHPGRRLENPAQGNRKLLVSRPVRITDLQLRVYVPRKRSVVRDVNCDSQFMIDTVHEIGSSIRTSYSFVPQSTPIILFMDNAGGHGKKNIKEQYVKLLKDQYNIEVEWQVPNSPETNMLDLGTWLSLQSKVEVSHRDKVMNKDVLADTVEKCWNDVDMNEQILKKVHQRWKLVLELILKGKGTNNLVERHRGIKSKLLDMPDVPDSDEEDVVQNYINSIGTDIVPPIESLQDLKITEEHENDDDST